MASHFQWYPSTEEVVVPFNARYSFPSQANKAVKVTPRIPPVSGTTFQPGGGPIRITLPAQGYLNARNTTLSFDVTMTSSGNCAGEILRFQNNIQSIFQRARLLYGSTPLEDIPNYNVIVRQLTEWTGTNQIATLDQTSINEGIGGVTFGRQVNGAKQPGLYGDILNPDFTEDAAQIYAPAAANQIDATSGSFYPYPSDYPTAATFDAGTSNRITVDTNYALTSTELVNTRQKYIQGINFSNGAAQMTAEAAAIQQGGVPNQTAVTTVQYRSTRRYTIQLALGLFQQEKLIPLKWMASQLTVELTLADAASCMFLRTDASNTLSVTHGALPTYSVSNVNLIPEILEFDASYDAMFLKGLREGGVPIKFATWHTFVQNVGDQNSVNFIIPEKSRSIKSVFTIQRRGQDIMTADSGAAFFSSGTTMAVSAQSTLQSFQYRIGGRYFPAAPVQCSLTPSSTHSNGGSEALVELQKALNNLGDYRLSVGINTTRWALPNVLCFSNTSNALPATPTGGTINKRVHNNGEFVYNPLILNEADYDGGEILRYDLISPSIGSGPLSYVGTADQYPTAKAVVPGSASIIGSTHFCAAIDLETSSGLEISGLNAEEQSDIAFIAQYSGNQATNNVLEAYVYFDAMIVLRENNVLELIQ